MHVRKEMSTSKPKPEAIYYLLAICSLLTTTRKSTTSPQAHYGIYYRKKYHKSAGVVPYRLRRIPQVLNVMRPRVFHIGFDTFPTCSTFSQKLFVKVALLHFPQSISKKGTT